MFGVGLYLCVGLAISISMLAYARTLSEDDAAELAAPFSFDYMVKIICALMVVAWPAMLALCACAGVEKFGGWNAFCAVRGANTSSR